MIKSPVFLAVVLLLVTLAAVGYQALELNKVRLGKDLSVNRPQQIEQKKQITPAKEIPTLAQLGKRNLMGDPKKSLTKPVTENVVPVAALKLTLMGTIVKTEGGQNSAFIQGGNRETRRYYVGESVEGGFIVDSVAVDAVVLKRGEQLETLKYPAANASTVNVAPPVAATNPAARPVINKPQQQATPAAVAPANQPISLRERMRNTRINQNGRATQPPAGQ